MIKFNIIFLYWLFYFLQPFGDGILTLMLPQIRQVDKMLFLWSQSNLSSPVFSFTGHEDNILDFHWRKMKEGMSILKFSVSLRIKFLDF